MSKSEDVSPLADRASVWHFTYCLKNSMLYVTVAMYVSSKFRLYLIWNTVERVSTMDVLMIVFRNMGPFGTILSPISMVY